MKTAVHPPVQRRAEPDSGRARPFFSRGVQAKLKVGTPGDRFETEADAAADGAVHARGPFARGGMIAPRLTPTVQRAAMEEEAQATPLEAEAAVPVEEEVQRQPEEEEVQAQAGEEEEVQARAEEEEVQPQAEEEEVQAQAEAEEVQTQSEEEEVQAQAEEEEVQARAAPQRRRDPQPLAWVERRLRASRGLGNPLPEESRRRLEANFGRELSGIRIHTDALAAELSRALRAQAFAHGRDIYFNEGRFQPGTPEGDHLLAHEIAHTVQQGAVQQQVVQLQPEDDPDVVWVRPEAIEAVRLARGEIGTVNAKITDSEGNRVGYEHLLKFFRTAFGGDVIHPSVIQKIVMVPKPGGGEGKQDAMPHWCGLFDWWALKTAGVPLPNWKLGMSILQFVEPRPKGTLPQKGDIAYRTTNDHFALVSGVESAASAAGKAVKDVKVRTINGNTAGADNLGGQVQERWDPISAWLTFFDPMAKLPLPDVPLVKTTRDSEDAAAGPPPAETEAEAAAAEDPGPSDVAHLAEDVPATAEALPGAEAEVALEIPPPAPLPPPEPVAKVEKVSLEGSSDAAMASFVAAPASAVAATGPDLGGALDGKIVSEQVEAAASVPELHAQTGGDLDPGITPAEAIPVPAGAELGDGVTGATPAPLVAQPHQDKAPPPTNTETEKLMDEQPEGGFLAWLRGAIGSLMGKIRTTDPGVSTSTGPRQQVALAGEADPERMARQKEEGAGQLRAQRDTQVAAFKNHPGQSNIKPRQIDEARKPEMSAEPATQIAPTPPAPTAADYVEAQLPKEVRDQADSDLAPTLEPGLSEAGGATGEAAKTRDKDSTKEKEVAAAKARQINETADAEQKKAVLHGRTEVARQQGEGVAGAYEKVDTYSKDAAKEQTSQRKAVGEHVQSEEGKARKELEDGEKKAQKEKDDREAEAAAKKKKLEEEQKDESWWDKAAGFVKKAVEKVTEAIDGIFTALREAVATIIEKAKEAAVGLINAARDWVVDKLNGFRDWAKSQVDKYLKDSFPGLASAINIGIDATVDLAVDGVNFAADTAIAGVEALADGLAAVLDKILAVYQTALKAAVQIAGAVVTGDFAEALKIAIKAACDIAGIDSKPIFDFLDRAGSLLTSILKDPVPFINNLMSAVGQGIRAFGDNIVAHLQKGLISWLIGAIAEAGITLPEKFDLLGIFSLVAQILGLTYANVKARIIKKLPAAATVFDMIEKGFTLVMKLKDLDFSGLWEEAKAALANLKETVIGGIRNWVITAVIKEGIIWLLSLLNPASAIVKALKALFDLAMWLIERFEQIKDFVMSVYDAVAKIAAGTLEPAAKAVEDALSRALPVVISMVASLIGLGGVGKAVKEVLEKITAPINKVIDAVIDKVIAFAKKLIGKVKAGAKKVKEAVTNFLWPKKTFKGGDGESHTIEIGGGAGARRLQIRSTPVPAEQFIDAYLAANPNLDPAKKDLAVKAKDLVDKQIRPLVTKINKFVEAKPPQDVPEADGALLLQHETRLSEMLGQLVVDDKLAKAKERYKLEGLTGTYSKMVTMTGDALTPDHQPQNKAFQILSDKWYFNDPWGGAAMRQRAASRAASAYVINLAFRRHVAGRTYGRQPTEFNADTATREQKVPNAETAKNAQTLRAGAVQALQTELRKDVTAMKTVVGSTSQGDKQWSDLDTVTKGNAKEKKTLMDQIRTQVLRGEGTIAAQSFSGLYG